MTEEPAAAAMESNAVTSSRGAIALRFLPALVFYLFVCQAQTAAIVVLMFLLSTSSPQIATVLLGAGLVWLSRHAPHRRGDVRARRKLRVITLAAIVAVSAALSAALSPTEAGSFLLTVAACQGSLWIADSRARIRGVPSRHVGRGLALWVFGAWLGGYVLSMSVVLVVCILLLVRESPTLSRLLRHGGLVAWQVVLATAVLGLLVAQIVHSFQAMPNRCELAHADGVIPSTDDNDRFFTVATLGDSSTYGIFLPRRLTYPALLEDRLAAASPDRPVRVLNCSFSGATSDHGADQLADALRYHPAVVTISLGDNDDLGDNDKWAGSVKGESNVRVSEHLGQNLAALVRKCRESGVVPILLTSPAGRMGGAQGMRWVHRPTRELALRESVDLVDADLAVRARAFPPMHFIADFGHPNQWGHALIAERLAERVAPYAKRGGSESDGRPPQADRIGDGRQQK